MLDCGFECHRVGGPWIAENPACPYHNGTNSDRQQEIRSILEQVWYREISADDGYDLIESLL